MRFRLSSLLLFVTLLAVALGLGFQMHLIRQELADVRNEVQTLRQRPLGIVVGQPVRPRSQGLYQLLKTEGAHIPYIERGMKADELQQRQRLQRSLEEEKPATSMPEVPGQGLGNNSA